MALVLPYNPLIERTGLQNLSVRWATALARQGHAATIVTLGPSGAVDGAPIAGHATLRRLLRTLVSGRWDAIHWLEVWPGRGRVLAQHATSWLCRRRGARVVLTTETPGNLTDRGGGRLAISAARVAYSGFAVPSAEFLDEYARFGIGAERVTVVPHGLLPDEPFRARSPAEVAALRHEYGLDPALPVVLYIGRLVQRKRPLDFVAAVGRLAARGERFQALIVGDGLRHEDGMDREVRDAVRSSGGAVEQRPMSDRPWDYMALSDVVVVPSERDGQAFVVLEALACGAVPVVSDVPVLRTTLETSDGQRCGILFQAGDTDALANAIRRLLNDPSLRRTLRANALRWMAEGRNLEAIVPTLVALYEAGSPC